MTFIHEQERHLNQGSFQRPNPEVGTVTAAGSRSSRKIRKPRTETIDATIWARLIALCEIIKREIQTAQMMK